jgi:hypothetical protein
MDCNQDVNLTLTFPVTIPVIEGVKHGRIAFMLQEYLHDWSDGRYPFAVEQLKVALRDCVKRALYDAVSEIEMKKHTGEYVEFESDDGKVSGKTATWVLTTEEIMKDVHPYVREDSTVMLSERPARTKRSYRG